MGKLLLLLGILLSLQRSAVAEPFTLSGSGFIDEAYCSGCFQSQGIAASVGDAVTFALSYPTISPPDTAPNDPFWGFYSFGMGSLALSIGEQTLTIQSSMFSNVGNDLADITERHDQLAIEVYPERSSAVQIGLWLSGVDFQGNWLNGDRWPTDVVAALASAPLSSVYLVGPCGDDECLFAGIAAIKLFNLTHGPVPPPLPEPVPEATNLSLLGTGLLGLVALGRWRQRKAS